MSLMDVSLAHAREVPTHPLLEGAPVSSEGDPRRRLRVPEGSHPSRHTCAPVVSPEGMTYAGGEEWQGLTALHGLAAVNCA